MTINLISKNILTMKRSVTQNNFSKSSLETLTSSQLIDLADEYGIDIPDDLNRRFIIAELIEVFNEMNEKTNFKETIKESNDATENISKELPLTYNETKIDIVLRNPVSIFVYWDFNEVQLKQILASKINVYLKVSFFNELTEEKPDDSFDIQINYEDREQYILIPGGKKIVSVDLMQNVPNTIDAILAVSSKLVIPEGSEEFRNLQPGEDLKIKPILELSGIKSMLKKYYNNYRQSFN